MEYPLMILSILIFTLQTISFKEFNRTFMKNLKSYFLFNFLYFGVIVLTFLILNTQSTGVHASTAILAVCFGVAFTITILLYMKAMEIGPLSYSSLIFAFGILVPIIFGLFIWKEKVSIIQATGLLLLFITFYFGGKSTSGSSQKISMRWLIFCITSLIGNGGLMTLTKAQQMIMPGKEIKEFLILAFGTAAIFSLMLFLFRKNKTDEPLSHLKSWSFVLIVFVAGFTTAFGNQIGLYLSGRIPAVIQFPTVSGGIVIFSSILSIVLFKEKLSRYGMIGLILGLAALVLLSVK